MDSKLNLIHLLGSVVVSLVAYYDLRKLSEGKNKFMPSPNFRAKKSILVGSVFFVSVGSLRLFVGGYELLAILPMLILTPVYNCLLYGRFGHFTVPTISISDRITIIY